MWTWASCVRRCLTQARNSQLGWHTASRCTPQPSLLSMVLMALCVATNLSVLIMISATMRVHAGYEYMLDPDHAPAHPQDLDLSPKKAEGHPEAVDGPCEFGDHLPTGYDAFRGRHRGLLVCFVEMKAPCGRRWGGRLPSNDPRFCVPVKTKDTQISTCTCGFKIVYPFCQPVAVL